MILVPFVMIDGFVLLQWVQVCDLQPFESWELGLCLCFCPFFVHRAAARPVKKSCGFDVAVGVCVMPGPKQEDMFSQ